MDSDEKNKLLRRILSYFFVFVFIMGLIVWISRLGPKRVDMDESWRSESFDESVEDEGLAQLLIESERLEQAFLGSREQGDTLNAEHALMLEEAIRLQRAYVERLGRVDIDAIGRLKRLEELLQNEQADVLLEESLELERVGRSALSEGDKDVAINTLYQAAYLQKEINEQYPLSQAADYGRPIRLSRIIQDLEAEPLSIESYTAERAAREALDIGDGDQAKKLFQTATVLQERINTDYKNTRYVDFARLNALIRDVQTIEAAGLHAHFLSVVKQAEEYEKSGNYQNAAQAYASARALQEELNQKYPKSRYASSSRISSLRHAEQLALSQTSLQSLKDQLSKLDIALAHRDVEAATKHLNELDNLWMVFQKEYALVVQEQSVLAEKIEYLMSRKGNLKAILNAVYGQLMAVPGVLDRKLFNAEMPQGLFRLVMASNPSRHVGDDLPVDSVSWEEATRFCKYLAWCIGRPVELPDERLFRDALGQVNDSDISSQTWNATNSGIKTHPIRTKSPNAHGGYDLLGNVAEWLDADPSLETAAVIGGSMEDLPQILEQVPLVDFGKQSRSRTIGFRFCVYFLND
tara:strand:- start:5142 stop:6878 length:1737 start_codon:yes stop_codon:yes gene_type:complete